MLVQCVFAAQSIENCYIFLIFLHLLYCSIEGVTNQIDFVSNKFLNVFLKFVGASTCRKEQVREYYTENNCRSRQPLKYAKCVGGCGNQCCTASITRRRKVRMVCSNNAKYVKTLNIVRKCSCSKKCN